LQFILYPIAKPVAAALDYFLGPDHPTVYRRAELKELTKRHLITEGAHGELKELKELTKELKELKGVKRS